MFRYKETLLVATIVFVTAMAQLPSKRTQLIRFFGTPNCLRGSGNPPYYNYTDNVDLSTLSLQSYCVVQGAWRIHYPESLSEYVISVGDSCTECHKKPANRKFGYIQRLGAPDLTQAWIYLYRDESFRELGGTVNGLEYNLNATYSFSSVAFSSFSNWTWQLYYSPRFRGSSVCLRPNHGSEVTLLYPQTVNVGSIRRGCRNSGNSLGHQMGFIGIVVVIAVSTIFFLIS